MYEVERKVRIEHDQIRDRLESFEAHARGTIEQHDTYFDHPSRSFAETDEALRVRRQSSVDGNRDTEDYLTYKGPRLSTAAKTRVEHETVIEDASEVTTVLEALGFSRAGVVTKVREAYDIDECLVCLDAVEGLGEFVEVEASEAFDSVEEAGAAIERIVDALGLGAGEAVSESYLALVLETKGSA